MTLQWTIESGRTGLTRLSAVGVAAGGTRATPYTAFGRRVCALDGSCAPSPPPHRFGYAGAHGYQAPTSDTPADPYATDFPFLHVGARYYDPAIGRFLQRDPIGINAGPNVYPYVRSLPTVRVDPTGMYPFGGFPGLQPSPPPKPKPEILQSTEDMEAELNALRMVIKACAAGIVGALSGGIGGAIGGPVGGALGGGIGGAVGVGVGGWF